MVQYKAALQKHTQDRRLTLNVPDLKLLITGKLEDIFQPHYENKAEISPRGAIASFLGPDGIFVRLGSSWNVETT